MINNAIFRGRLTKDPEIKQTKSGKTVLTQNLAVQRDFVNQQTGKREADFIPIVAWDKTAEIIAQHCYKGGSIAVAGRFQSRTYENQSGQTVFVVELIVDRLDIIDFKDNGQGGGNNQYQNNQYQNNNQQQQNQQQGGWSGNQTYRQPANNQQQGNGFDFQNDNSFDISDDDLPF